jgi:hypothetical protein
MEAITIENAVFYGKVGADNLLLIVVGGLFFVLYGLKRQEQNFARLKIDLSCGFFFLVWGFCNDIYRFKPLRNFLLMNYNFQPFRTLLLLVTLGPLYYYLIDSIVKIIIARHARRK